MKFSRTLSLLFLLLAIYWSYQSLMPSYPEKDNSSLNFSTDRALVHVKNISQKPHAVGFSNHKKVRDYIINELKKLGLESEIQEGYTAGDWGNLSKAVNILARIKGSQSGKALLLLSHYDSSPHSSLGASDAGSGVATILEGIRAFLKANKTPKNDIIILITDAEELGLNGADLFVKEHPWAKEVGLVLNFEARGSGGPSYMLIETNRGNGKLIKEFTKANPSHPVANSLAYSIYKMLPNDTDLTVFREDADIDGFNFAFIDDHFDYHTALDSYERLDRKTLAHQGSYLMPLLEYFSEADISNMKSLNDYVYFNVPFFKLVTYPFEWIWPMFILAGILFIIFMFIGFKREVLDVKSTLLGFLPFILSLIINGLLGYFSWSLLKWWYPGFKDMLHGFTYNGHIYILTYVFLSLAVCFFIYHRFKKISKPNLMVGPIFIWLIICLGTNMYLQGASFFILPVFGLLAGFIVLINQKEPSSYLLVFLALPALFIFAPFVKMFPVGLGLKMMVASTLFVTLIFGLVLPFLSQIKRKEAFGSLFLILFLIFGVAGHLKSGFNNERPKPSSLLYVHNANEHTFEWATYDHQLMDWNGQFLEQQKKDTEPKKIISSKYNTRFTHTADAPPKDIELSKVEVRKDTVIENQRHLSICVIPRRSLNRLEVFTNEITLDKAKVNEITLSDYYLENRRNGKLVTHYISDNDDTKLDLVLPADKKLELTFYEASNDLLKNPQFSVPERPDSSIPMPFVLNDAILTIKTISFD